MKRATMKRKTLVDEFAMAALTGLLAQESRAIEPADLAVEAYMIAEAMVVERERRLDGAS